MAKTMTPSAAHSKAVTDGQLTKAVQAYRALLERHAPEFSSGAVQAVLGDPGFAGEMFALFRQRVEAKTSEVVRRVKVNRKRTPMQAIDATDRAKYVDEDVVAAMPKGEGKEVEVRFFRIGRWITPVELEQEYERRGYKPADPYTLAAINEADPAFANDKPNGTQWKDGDGKYCYAAFHRWDDEREVFVSRLDVDWFVSWWFAGLRK